MGQLKKLAIIGAGNVGGTLGRRWAENGHSVVYGTRHPNSKEAITVLRETRQGRSALPSEAAQQADVIVLANPWPATKSIVEGLGRLAGKIILDCTNPILPNLAGLELGHNTSGAEKVAQWAKGAHVVKILNTTGSNNMENPGYPQGRPVMLYCGDDPAAKQTAHQLATELGFDAVDAGPLTQARLLEPLAMLWISLAVHQGLGREFAFQLMKR